MAENYVLPSTIARRLDVDTRTVRRWCRENLIRHLTLPSGHHRRRDRPGRFAAGEPAAAVAGSPQEGRLSWIEDLVRGDPLPLAAGAGPPAPGGAGGPGGAGAGVAALELVVVATATTQEGTP